tara:strand:+ start:1674 stop:2699 length:1026 start_codon:yes stop_codon:yes gene_type:complete
MGNLVTKGADFDIAYGGANLNEIFYEPTFRSEDVLSRYRVIPNVKGSMNIFLSANLTKIVKKYTTCSSTSGTGSFALSDKKITAGKCRVALEQCADEFFGTYIEELYRTGQNALNVEGTVLEDIMVRRTVEGIGADVIRLIWGADGTTAEYDQLDGWFKLLGADTVVEAAKLEKIAADFDAPSAGEAIALLRDCFDKAPAALQQTPLNAKKMYVTPEVFNAYLANLEGTSADLAWSARKDGVAAVRFRGVELVPMYEWTTILTDLNPTLFDGGTTPMNASQGVIYGAVENFIIGTDVNDNEANFKMWYDDKDEKAYIRSYFKLGAQVLYSSLVQVGIFVTD